MQPIQTNREGKEKDLDNNKDEYKADSGPPGMEVDGVIESNWNEIADNFDEMNLREDLLRGIYAYGFEKPSAIQQRAIIPCIRGNDIIAKAQSGTGKTALFSISILQKLDMSIKNCQALILVPTRELAQQIRKVVLTLGDFMGVTCHACIGGITIRENLRILETGVQIMVGSPGRVSDLINRKALDPMTIKLIVVDEADEMLSRGFKEDIHYVFTKMPYNIQVMLSSSTLPSEVLELTKKFMREPIQF